MGLQFEHVTFTPQFSLTQIVDDAAHVRREGSVSVSAVGADIEAWLNAVQRQSTPLIQSPARRAELEAWLAAADSMTEGKLPDRPSGS
jgi:hypothetical protein